MFKRKNINYREKYKTDSGLQGVDIEIRNLVEKHLFQNLISHVKKLEEVYREDNRETHSR